MVKNGHRSGVKLVIALIVPLLLAGCATPYQRVGTTVAGGYSSNRLSPTAFSVRFSGNGFTKPKRAYDFAMLRAAEVALGHNFPYFVVTANRDETSTRVIQGNPTTFTTGTTNNYGTYGMYQGTTTTYNNNIPVTTPTIVLRISCLESRESAGKHAGQVFGAEKVKTELQHKYGLQ